MIGEKAVRWLIAESFLEELFGFLEKNFLVLRPMVYSGYMFILVYRAYFCFDFRFYTDLKNVLRMISKVFEKVTDHPDERARKADSLVRIRYPPKIGTPRFS